jgi:hypothetical protein
MKKQNTFSPKVYERSVRIEAGRFSDIMLIAVGISERW